MRTPRKALALFALVTAVLTNACSSCFGPGACVHHSSKVAYWFCIDTSSEACRKNFCDADLYDGCGFFQENACSEVGLATRQSAWSPPSAPDWSEGNFPSAGGGTYRFTCTSGSLCVEYALPTQARLDQLRAQCSSPGTGSCSRTGAKTCRHSNSAGDVTCTVTSNPPSDHDDVCRGTGGRVGC